MSYILDALKRADAERGRGAVPGLHTRQLANPSERDPAAAGARRALWLGAAAALALAGVGGSLWLWQTAPEAPLARVVQPVTIQPQVSAAVTPPVAVIAPEVTPVLPTAATQTAPAPAAAVPVVKAPIKAKPDLMRTAPAVATPSPVPAPPRATAKSAPVASPAVPASATSAAVPLLSELPDELRRQVPAMTITGAVYAENPAQRLLLVNNLVLAQGALAAPEVKLEEIQARSSVFSFRGTRFRVAH